MKSSLFILIICLYTSVSLTATLPEDLGEKICRAFKNKAVDEETAVSDASALFYNPAQSPTLRNKTNRDLIYAFLKAFYEFRPIASRYTPEEFFKHPDKGHATIIIYPQNNLSVPLPINVDGHCALVTEYFEKSFGRKPLVKKRLISLEVKEGGGFSGGGTHHVRVGEDDLLINSLVWHYESFYEENREIRRHDVGGYYPDTTFLVDLEKMKKELKVIDQHSMNGKHDYEMRANNCCTYVFDRLKGMGVDLKWPTGTLIHRAENLKAAAENSPSEKKKSSATPVFVPKTGDKVVYADVNIFKRLFKEYCKTCGIK